MKRSPRTIQQKLIAAFAFVVLVFVALSGFMIVRMGGLSESTTYIERRTTQTDAVNAANRALLQQNRNVLRAIAQDDPAVTEEMRALDAQRREEAQAAFAVLQDLTEGDGVDELAALQDSYRTMTALFAEQYELLEDGRQEDAVAQVRDNVVTSQEAGAAADETLAYFAERADQARADAAANYTSTRALTLGALLIVALAAGALASLIARGVSRSVSVSATAVTGSSDELAAVSTQLGAAAEETAAQANVVAAAGEQVSHNVSTVATAVEEMNASVREIAANAGDAASVAASAVSKADVTNATVAKLGESSAEISKVIEVITSIAEQTNLLALNATIEAARAGEAGKGFAVVANEVKELAKETAKATEEIGSRIAAIQTDADGAVSAIGEISAVIAQIADLQTTIAGAVEEQTATTSEIARNVNEAARGSAEIAENIASVATAAQQTSAGAQSTRAAAERLTAVAGDLQALVGHGDDTDRSAPTGGPVPAPVPV